MSCCGEEVEEMTSDSDCACVWAFVVFLCLQIKLCCSSSSHPPLVPPLPSSTRTAYLLLPGLVVDDPAAAPFMAPLSLDHRSSNLLAVDLSDGVRVGTERASRQDIALLHFNKQRVWRAGLDGAADGLVVVVGEASPEEDGLGRLAVVGGEGSVGAQVACGRCVEVGSGTGAGELGERGGEVEAAVDDLRGKLDTG